MPFHHAAPNSYKTFNICQRCGVQNLNFHVSQFPIGYKIFFSQNISAFCFTRRQGIPSPGNHFKYAPAAHTKFPLTISFSLGSQFSSFWTVKEVPLEGVVCWMRGNHEGTILRGVPFQGGHHSTGGHPSTGGGGTFPDEVGRQCVSRRLITSGESWHRSNSKSSGPLRASTLRRGSSLWLWSDWGSCGSLYVCVCVINKL